MFLVRVSHEFQKYFIFAVYMRDFAPFDLYDDARLRLKWTVFEVQGNSPENRYVI